MRRALTIVALSAFGLMTFAQTSPCEQVNLFIGTAGSGHTYPGATVPHGAVQLSPDTRREGADAVAGYRYGDTHLLGFSHTHLSGTTYADLADFLIRPCEEIPTFKHENEVAQPGYYSVTLDNGTFCELTATTYCGMHHYRYPQGTNKVRMVLDLGHVLDADGFASQCEADVTAPNEICGMRSTYCHSPRRTLYFVLRFQQPFSTTQVHGDYNISKTGKQKVEKTMDINIYGQDDVTFKLAISTTSIEDAKKNLEHDIRGFDFADVRARAKTMWEEELGRIQFNGGTDEQRTVFYTALYHSLIVPNVVSNADQLQKQYVAYAESDSLKAWDTLMSMLRFQPSGRTTQMLNVAEGGLFGTAKKFASQGKQDVANYYIYRAQSELFRNAPDGIPGSDNSGLTSAWYVLTAMGLYPLSPEQNEWARCKPLFDDIFIDNRPIEEVAAPLFVVEKGKKGKKKKR